MRSLVAKNIYSTPTGARRASSVERLRESQLPDTLWHEFEKTAISYFGIDTGTKFVAAMRRGEHDYAFAAATLLGVPMKPWQLTAFQALHQKPFVMLRGPNALGKTTGLALFYLLIGTYRYWAPAWWDTYRMLHHGPQEVHALQAKVKMDAILRGNAREQWDEATREYRPCLLAPFIRAMQHDGKKHAGFDWFGGSSMLTFRSTAYQAQGSDGTDPYFIGEDELRHEDNFTHVVRFIFIPRSLRAEGMRMFLPFTSLEASAELSVAFEQGLDHNDPDWLSIDIDDLASSNDAVSKEAIARVKRTVGRRAEKQVLGGRAIQPLGAKFNARSAAQAFYGNKEPEYLCELGKGVCKCASCEAHEPWNGPSVRERVAARCEMCKRKALRNPYDAEANRHHHAMLGFIDPASSAKADDIVATIWDLEPPGGGVDVVYIEALEPGTPIQHVVRHASAMSKHIDGPVGYDKSSALGHNVLDLLVELDPDGDFLEHGWEGSREAKDRDLDYFGGLMDLGLWHCPLHLYTRTQIVNYVRKDDKIATDFLIAQVGAAAIARDNGFLPELPGTEDISPAPAPEILEEARLYTGLGGGEGGGMYAGHIGEVRT